MKVLVLSSGGIDSTTCVSMAIKKHGKENVSTVTIYYGQKLSKEIECARRIAQYYGLKHYEFDLQTVFKYSECSLMINGKNVEHKDYGSQIKDGGIISSYVPFRNGLMLSVCATLAQSLYPKEECEIYLGNHASDFAYADCSEAFVDKMGEAVEEGTYGYVHFNSPLLKMTKTEVVALGIALNAPYDLTWSCYEGKDEPCHECGSCIERENAFRNNGVHDPLCLSGND